MLGVPPEAPQVETDTQPIDVSSERQRIERVAGLAPREADARAGHAAPSRCPRPTTEDPDAETGQTGGDAASGPNDERLRRDVPPHY